MSNQSKTERGNYAFVVKEYGEGEHWIMLEQAGENLEVLGNGFLGLDVREGVSFREAQEIAAMLTQKISAVSFTNFLKSID